MSDKTLAVVIMRAQIFHNGHKFLLEQALKSASNVLVLVGSAKESRTIHNPFTFNERRRMILDSMDPFSKLVVRPLSDYSKDEDWQNAVKDIARSMFGNDSDCDAKIALVGHFKDSSSYYLRSFKSWDTREVEAFGKNLSAVTLRNNYFGTQGIASIRNAIPEGTHQTLVEFGHTSDFLDIMKLYQAQQTPVDQSSTIRRGFIYPELKEGQTIAMIFRKCPVDGAIEFEIKSFPQFIKRDRSPVPIWRLLPEKEGSSRLCEVSLNTVRAELCEKIASMCCSTEDVESLDRLPDVLNSLMVDLDEGYAAKAVLTCMPFKELEGVIVRGTISGRM